VEKTQNQLGVGDTSAAGGIIRNLGELHFLTLPQLVGIAARARDNLVDAPDPRIGSSGKAEPRIVLEHLIRLGLPQHLSNPPNLIRRPLETASLPQPATNLADQRNNCGAVLARRVGLKRQGNGENCLLARRALLCLDEFAAQQTSIGGAVHEKVLKRGVEPSRDTAAGESNALPQACLAVPTPC